ncbi:MAG: hypothetical protein ACM34A_09080 [Bacillota bacterium]
MTTQHPALSPEAAAPADGRPSVVKRDIDVARKSFCKEQYIIRAPALLAAMDMDTGLLLPDVFIP